MPNEQFYPDWLDSDQYITSEHDQKLLLYFQALFQHLDNAERRNNAILGIWKALLHHRRLLISKHPDGLETMTQTYLWLTASCIVLTASLIEATHQYCQQVNSDRVEQIKKHLKEMQESDSASQDYRRACQYLRLHLEKLLDTSQPHEQAVDQPNLQPIIQVVRRVPRIALFQPGKPDLTTSLTRWIKGYQVWRIRDLRKPDADAPASLNTPLGFADPEAGERLDQIPNGAQNIWSAPSLDDLMKGNLIDELMHDQVQQQAAFIEQYINTDPDERLKANFPNGYRGCHYQLLAQRLYLKEPPDTIREIAEEFEIDYNKLYAVVAGKERMSLYNLLPALLIDAYFQPEALQKAIQADIHQVLRKCHVRNYPKCHAQFLAMHRLRLFTPMPRSFEDITAELKQNYGYNRLTAAQIEAHWHNRCLHRVGQLIQALNEQSEAKFFGGQS